MYNIKQDKARSMPTNAGVPRQCEIRLIPPVLLRTGGRRIGAGWTILGRQECKIYTGGECNVYERFSTPAKLYTRSPAGEEMS